MVAEGYGGSPATFNPLEDMAVCVYGGGMDKRQKTLQTVTSILGNISAISAGIAIYEKSMAAVYITLIFAVMAVLTSRSE